MKRAAIATSAALIVVVSNAHAQTDAPDDQAQLIAWPRVLELQGTLGGAANSGGPTSDPARFSVFGSGRIDIASIDAVAIRAWVGRFEIVGRSPSYGVVAMGLVSIDEAIIGGHSTLGDDGKRVTQPCIYLINAPCVSGGYLGFGLDLLRWQYTLESARNILRVGEATVVVSPEPAYGSSGTGGAVTSAGWMQRHFPIRIGASADYVYGIPVTNTWVGRLVVGADAVVRFANQHGELEARFRYRPSFTAWVDDFGIEASLYLGFVGGYTFIQHQGASWRLGVELGYAYWSEPDHSFGTAWDEIGRHTAFARVIFQPTLWTVR